ncbi:hypothetical protein [Nitratireductor soli]|uniref:hypothetical protein n=1 Tax=Nitratireductor soli TaxID=1670619 RepID=UPI00065E1C06|nr:hypothetical protein [Nitratireductor soli]
MSRILHASFITFWLLGSALAQEAATSDGGGDRASGWPAKKCLLFRQITDEALARIGVEGMGPAFLEKQERFIASGCLMRIAICPTAPKELDYANLVSLQMMNAGATGSFLPFACR